jgi:AcrR family transcriptional regulator
MTRRRVVEAAAAAFAASGWAGTTLAGIARAAGVTPQAVHLSVGAKPALLIEAVRHAVAGGQPDVPLTEREPFSRAYAEGAAVPERAAAFAAGTRGVYERAGPLFLVLAGSASLDPGLAALWERARAGRRADCLRLVALTGERSPASAQRLADLLFVQSGPGVHADLVGDLGWTGAAYENWLRDTVQGLLSA